MPEMRAHDMPENGGTVISDPACQQLAAIFGIGAVLISILELASIHVNLPVYAFLYPGYKTIAFSAAIIWILFGLILAFHAKKPFRGVLRSCILAVIAVIAIFSLIEFPLEVLGQHFAAEVWMYQIGNVILANPTTPISPVAAGLIIPTSFAMFFLVYVTGSRDQVQRMKNAAGILGLFVFLISITFLLSYIYGIPFLYGTPILPIAPASTIALLLLGAGLISTAGPKSFPLAWFMGNSTKSHLLRTFVPLVIILIFVENFLTVTLFPVYKLNTALTMALFLVTITIITTYVVGRASATVGTAIDSANQKRRTVETALKKSEAQLRLAIIASRLGTWDWDLESGELTMSGEGKTMFGLPPGEPITYEIFLSALHPGDREQTDCAVRQALEEQTDYNTEYRAVWPDKTVRWISAIGRGDYDESGKAVRMRGVTLDITQRKQEELLIREMNEDLSQAQSIAHVGSWQYDLVGNVITWSDETYRIFGYEPGQFDLKLEKIRERIHPDDLDLHDQVLAGAITAHYYPPEEYRLIRPDGTIRTIYGTGRVIDDDSGAVVKIIGVIQDITERKAVEVALRDALIQWKTTFGATNDAICLLGADQKIVQCNQAMLDLFNLRSEDELIGRQCWEIVHGTTTAIPDCPIMRLKQSHHREEMVFNTGDKWFDVTVDPIFGEQEQLTGFVHTIRDVTAAKRAESALRQSEQFLDNIVEHIPDMIFVKDAADLRYVRLNTAGENLLGYSREDMVGKNDYDFFPKTEAESFTEKDREVLIRNQLVDIPEDKVYTRSLGERILHTKKIPLVDEEGKPKYLLGISEDITERKKDEERTRLTNRKLALMTDITYQDIQNKVTGLRAYAGLMNEAANEQDRLSLITKEDKVLATIQRLIKNTKDYQQMGIDQSRWMLLEQIIRVQWSLMSQKDNVVVHNDVNGLEIYADPLIERVFYNLIHNALHHGKKITRVSFGWQETPEGLVVVCEDDGIGIPAEQKPHIFDRVVGGGGKFGLFFAREFLTLSGMAITENGEPGKGARFEITLPKGAYRFTDGK
ncbi:MAG: PAS domain S-box protein [Methanoregula sp.]